MAERIVSGREFQILGAVTRKARAAVVVDSSVLLTVLRSKSLLVESGHVTTPTDR